jgi:cytochrome c-type biogenesis protein CcmH
VSAMHAAFIATSLAVAAAALWWVLRPLRAARRGLAGTAAVALPVCAVAAYLWLGTPQALELAAQEPPHQQGPADLRGMVDRLQARLQAQPGDVEGWFMLARSHQVLEQWEPAAHAYRRALALAPEDADLLADLADVLGVIAQGELEGEPRALLQRALAADAGHAKSLLLLAAADLRQGRISQAKGHWEALLRVAPGDSQAAAIARESLERLEQAGTQAPEKQKAAISR